MSTLIKDLRARAIIDCKGKPLLEVDVITEDGVMGRGASPSGISAGIYEATCLRDGDPNWYDGNGVFKAKEIAETIMQMSEVESVYLMSGNYDLSVTVKGRSFKEVALFVAKRLAVMENIESTTTSFVLRRYKEIGVEMMETEKDDRGAFSF